MNELIPIIAILSTTALPIGFGMFLGLRSMNIKHKEHMGLIRQGIVPPNDKVKPTPNRYRSLRNGFLCIGIALGIISGYVISSAFQIFEEESFFIFGASVLFFLGLAYILFYIVTNKKDSDSEYKPGLDDEIE